MARILIAEDERDIRELVTISLRGLGGFDVTQAVNGVEAVERARAEHPDLILMDVRMPKMNGYEACRRLKESAETKDIPIVFLSAKGQESEIQKGLTVGAVQYILKPFAPDELVREVRSLLKRFKASK